MSAMPKVQAYPMCSECQTPYVLRLTFVIAPKPRERWLWQRDCKHKKADAVARWSDKAPREAPQAP